MVSLKPPWRQKNPIMEKACQTYQRNTAPREAVKIMENLSLQWRGSKLEGEVVHSMKAGGEEGTTVIFKRGSFPHVVAVIRTADGGQVRFLKTVYAGSVPISYKGEQVGKMSEGYDHFILRET